MADVMRDFMANAVLFQDAVAAPAASTARTCRRSAC